jgi:sortase A
MTALIAFIGATALTYSPAASWFSSLNQSQIVRQYETSINHTVPSAAEQLEAADRYNAALSSGASVEANTRKPVSAGKAHGVIGDYWKLLVTPTGVMARIQIPKIGVDLPIFHGTSDATLLKGAGHLEGTSLPVGGKGALSVITGHRGLAEATMFTNLDELRDGDTFTITTFTRVLTYRIFDIRVVEPSDTQSLHPQAGKDLVTLITCTPLGINSHRILVTGERIEPTPAAATKASRSSPTTVTFPWWAVLYLGGLALIAVHVWWGGRFTPTTRPTPAPDDHGHGAEPRRTRRRTTRATRATEEAPAS